MSRKSGRASQRNLARQCCLESVGIYLQLDDDNGYSARGRGNADDDFQTSSVAASPVRHAFGRRPVMTAKYIEHVNRQRRLSG
jgi:hypothetical protein